MDKKYFVFLSLMVGYIATVMYLIFQGPKHPQIAFWLIMGMFAIVVKILISPNIKEVIILGLRMVALAVVGQVVFIILSALCIQDTLIGSVITLVVLAPFYFPLLDFYCKLIKKSRGMLKKEN